MSFKKGLVSIVVPTHGNRNLNLLNNSIKDSLYKNVEIIIVNQNKERSEQRNLGIDRAQGEFLLWLDSDQSVSPMLISECVRTMNWHEYCNGLYIPEVIVAESFFGKIRKFEREFYTGTAIDCVRFVRMSICPRFNTELKGPEDSDFDRRVPHRKMTTTHVLYHHDDIKPHEYFIKKTYYGKSLNKYAELNPDDKCLDLKYRCWDVFVENGKWRKLVCHPILTFGIIFLLAIRGIIYARR
jgi:glycosyltransferase involved in cell wall biosynthesis